MLYRVDTVIEDGKQMYYPQYKKADVWNPIAIYSDGPIKYVKFEQESDAQAWLEAWEFFESSPAASL